MMGVISQAQGLWAHWDWSAGSNISDSRSGGVAPGPGGKCLWQVYQLGSAWRLWEFSAVVPRDVAVLGGKGC